MKFKSNKIGVCPVCNSDLVEYDFMELAGRGDMIYYPYICKNCGAKGEEWYELSFAGHIMKDEENNEYIVADVLKEV